MSKKTDYKLNALILTIELHTEAAYKEAIKEAAKVGAGIKGLGKEPFKMSDYPKAKAEIDSLVQILDKKMQTTILNGVTKSWELANGKNDALVKQVFGDTVDKFTPELRSKYFSNNALALQAFLARKIGGLNLSEKVWKYTDGFKNEIEMALDLGIRSGKSAAAMARDLQDYLQHPNKLFRRVKDEHGQLHLSKAAKAYHPSTGVYRSSYMNARRLAVTETNIAYRTADHIRHQQLDFIVGIRILLSNNHNCKGVPAGMFFDICDELKGDYPKDFMFTGWHPHCRCHTETILKTKEEMQEDTKRLLNGDQPLKGSKNEVKKTPKQFDNWVKDHKKKIEAAEHSGKLPYFLKDNNDIYSKILEKEPLNVTRAAARHAARTPEQAKKIQEAWDKRRAEYAAIDKDFKELDAIFKEINDVDTDTIEAAYKKNDLKTVKAEIQKLKDAKDELESVTWIENPFEEAKKYSMDIVLDVDYDIQLSFDKWQHQYGYKHWKEASLKQQKAKFEYDLKNVHYDHKLQDRELATKILQKELDKINDAIKYEEYQNKQHYFIGYFEAHKTDKELAKQIKALQNAMKSKDLATIEGAMQDLNETKKRIDKAAKAAKGGTKIKLNYQYEDVALEPNESQITSFWNVKTKTYTANATAATDYVIEQTNVLSETMAKFAKTKEGQIFDKKDLEMLANCKSGRELSDAIYDLKSKYRDNWDEYRKLRDVIDDVRDECELQARAVTNFTYEWDYEIRSYQMKDPTLIPRNGHTLAEIKERSESLERFIECSPKWDGGTTYRGMTLSQKELDNMVNDLKAGKAHMKGTASWTTDEDVAEGFSTGWLGEQSPEFGDEKEKCVILRAIRHERATPIMHLSRCEWEHEVLSSQYERWKFVKMVEKDEFVYIDVEPA